jgi:hypothetical protein
MRRRPNAALPAGAVSSTGKPAVPLARPSPPWRWGDGEDAAAGGHARAGDVTGNVEYMSMSVPSMRAGRRQTLDGEQA